MSVSNHKQSRDIQYGKVGLAIIAVLIGTIILGYIYAIINFYNPIIYLSVLAAIGFGIALLFLLKVIIWLAHIRNTKAKFFLIIVMILLATYFQWSAFIGALLLGRPTTPMEYINIIGWIFNPSEVFDILRIIYQEGTWSLGLLSNIPVSGIFLAVIWLLEIVFTALPSVKFLADKRVNPYSEKLNKWYPKFTLTNDFESIYSEAAIKPSLDLNVIQAIQNLGNGNGLKYCKIHLFYLEEEVEQYLRIERCFVENHGKGKTTSAIILDNYPINSSVALEIKNTFECIKGGIGIL